MYSSFERSLYFTRVPSQCFVPLKKNSARKCPIHTHNLAQLWKSVNFFFCLFLLLLVCIVLLPYEYLISCLFRDVCYSFFHFEMFLIHIITLFAPLSDEGYFCFITLYQWRFFVFLVILHSKSRTILSNVNGDNF